MLRPLERRRRRRWAVAVAPVLAEAAAAAMAGGGDCLAGLSAPQLRLAATGKEAVVGVGVGAVETGLTEAWWSGLAVAIQAGKEEIKEEEGGKGLK